MAYRSFHPLDFTVIYFMQVNDCKGGRREGATRTVHSKGRTRGGRADDSSRVGRMMGRGLEWNMEG